MTTTQSLSNYEITLRRNKHAERQRMYRKKNPEPSRRACKRWRDKKRPEEKREYHRVRHLKFMWGMAPEQWDELFLAQGEACAICRTKARPTTGWVVDHCHATDLMRGILCPKCNFMLGNARDNPTILSAGVEYLGKFNGKEGTAA